MERAALMSRRPVAGAVKTRLSPALPAEQAGTLFRGMLADAIAALAGCRAGARAVFWTGARAADPPPLPAGWREREQAGGDLGERLVAAFAALLEAPGDRAVVIGADCPELAAGRLDEAFAALDGHDAVLGPAADGGYYLVGLAAPAPALFAGIPWGSGAVLEGTLTRARAAGLRVALLGRLDDMDTPADLVGFIARRLAAGRPLAPATEGALAGLGLLPPP